MRVEEGKGSGVKGGFSKTEDGKTGSWGLNGRLGGGRGNGSMISSLIFILFSFLTTY